MSWEAAGVFTFAPVRVGEPADITSSVLANRPVALGVVSLAAWDTPASHGVPHAVAFTSIHPNGGARSRLPLVGDSITQWLSHDIGHALGLQPTHKQDQCSICMRRTRQCSPGCSALWTILVLNDGSVCGKKSTLCTRWCWHGAERAFTAPASSGAQTSAPGHRCLPPHKPLRQDRSRCRDQAGTGRDRCQRHRRCR